MDGFLMVSPTGAPINDTVAKWTKSEQEHAIKLWRTQMRGDAPIKDDAAVTDADIQANNLVLWGDPQSNKLLARIADKLPIQWTADAVVLGSRASRRHKRARHDLPESAESTKILVINSGITFREYAEPNNSLQVAYLPDYAVVDLTTPPDARWPGKIVAAGFFGEKWELLPNDGQ